MRDRLIGTWKLVSAVREEMSSARVDQLGANAHRIGPYLNTRKTGPLEEQMRPTVGFAGNSNWPQEPYRGQRASRQPVSPKSIREDVLGIDARLPVAGRSRAHGRPLIQF
jgi:hypothetical protein